MHTNVFILLFFSYLLQNVVLFMQWHGKLSNSSNLEKVATFTFNICYVAANIFQLFFMVQISQYDDEQNFEEINETEVFNRTMTENSLALITSRDLLTSRETQLQPSPAELDEEEFGQDKKTPTFYFDTMQCKYVPLFVYLSNICLTKQEFLNSSRSSTENKRKNKKSRRRKLSPQDSEVGNFGASDQQ